MPIDFRALAHTDKWRYLTSHKKLDILKDIFQWLSSQNLEVTNKGNIRNIVSFIEYCLNSMPREKENIVRNIRQQLDYVLNKFLAIPESGITTDIAESYAYFMKLIGKIPNPSEQISKILEILQKAVKPDSNIEVNKGLILRFSNLLSKKIYEPEIKNPHSIETSIFGAIELCEKIGIYNKEIFTNIFDIAGLWNIKIGSKTLRNKIFTLLKNPAIPLEDAKHLLSNYISHGLAKHGDGYRDAIIASCLLERVNPVICHSATTELEIITTINSVITEAPPSTQTQASTIQPSTIAASNATMLSSTIMTESSTAIPNAITETNIYSISDPTTPSTNATSIDIPNSNNGTISIINHEVEKPTSTTIPSTIFQDNMAVRLGTQAALGFVNGTTLFGIEKIGKKFEGENPSFARKIPRVIIKPLAISALNLASQYPIAGNINPFSDEVSLGIYFASNAAIAAVFTSIQAAVEKYLVQGGHVSQVINFIMPLLTLATFVMGQDFQDNPAEAGAGLALNLTINMLIYTLLNYCCSNNQPKQAKVTIKEIENGTNEATELNTLLPTENSSHNSTESDSSGSSKVVMLTTREELKQNVETLSNEFQSLHTQWQAIFLSKNEQEQKDLLDINKQFVCVNWYFQEKQHPDFSNQASVTTYLEKIQKGLDTLEKEIDIKQNLPLDSKHIKYLQEQFQHISLAYEALLTTEEKAVKKGFEKGKSIGEVEGQAKARLELANRYVFYDIPKDNPRPINGLPPSRGSFGTPTQLTFGKK